LRFAWDTIFGPIIEILKPTKFVEVGAFQGSCTERILAHCRRHDGVPGHGYETVRCAGYAANLNSVAASDARALCSALI